MRKRTLADLTELQRAWVSRPTLWNPSDVVFVSERLKKESKKEEPKKEEPAKKKMKNAERIAELEKRVSELEARLGGK